MSGKPIDYYIKNLPFDVRQEIHKRMDKINSVIVREMLEKPQGYPSFKRMGYLSEHILAVLKIETERFQNVNDIMIENERNPLFSDPEDTYKSSLEYVDLLQKRTDEELIEKFGCTWEEYKPKKYAKDQQ